MLSSFMQMRRGVLRVTLAGLIAIMAGLGLSACQNSAQSWNSTDVTDTGIGRGWSMPDMYGNMRTAADFRGKVAVVFFGFIHCPDVCPTTLAQLVQVKEALGQDADKLQVLFVSVDPERDTPEIMREYLGAFDPSFLGLRGDPEQLAAAAQLFKVFYSKVEDKAGGTYTMDHSAGMYIFDPEGNIRLYARSGMPTEDLVADIRQLMG